MYNAPPPEAGIVDGTGSATDTSDTSIIAAPGPGFQLMITLVVIDNSHATTNSRVTLKGGKSNFGPIPAPSGDGGAIIRFDPAYPCSENTAFKFAALTSAATISVSGHGYKSKSGGH